MQIQFGGIEITASEVDGILVLSDMKGSGNPKDLIAVIRAVQEISKQTTVYLSVDIDNPRKEQIMKVYQHFGAVEKAILLEVK